MTIETDAALVYSNVESIFAREQWCKQALHAIKTETSAGLEGCIAALTHPDKLNSCAIKIQLCE